MIDETPNSWQFSQAMRLTQEQQHVIQAAVRRQDSEAMVVVFGSRADPQAKGGDIDLFVVSDHIGMQEEWEIRREILDAIGWQKLDLIVRRHDQLDSPISRIALAKGIAL